MKGWFFCAAAGPLLALSLLAWADASATDTVSGVPRIVDADTLVIHNTRVRIAGIDAPESQAKHTQHLSLIHI